MVGAAKFFRPTKQHGHFFLHDFNHAGNHGGPFRRIFKVFHAIEQSIKLRVRKIACIFTVKLGLRVWAVQQEQKIFWIRIVSQPSPEKELGRAFAHFVLKTVVVCVSNFNLDIELGKLFRHPIQACLVARAHTLGVIVQHQWLSCFEISAVWIACLGQ